MRARVVSVFLGESPAHATPVARRGLLEVFGNPQGMLIHVMPCHAIFHMLVDPRLGFDPF